MIRACPCLYYYITIGHSHFWPSLYCGLLLDFWKCLIFLHLFFTSTPHPSRYALRSSADVLLWLWSNCAIYGSMHACPLAPLPELAPCIIEGDTFFVIDESLHALPRLGMQSWITMSVSSRMEWMKCFLPKRLTNWPEMSVDPSYEPCEQPLVERLG
jgi:hypothetical protein